METETAKETNVKLPPLEGEEANGGVLPQQTKYQSVNDELEREVNTINEPQFQAEIGKLIVDSKACRDEATADDQRLFQSVRQGRMRPHPISECNYGYA